MKYLNSGCPSKRWLAVKYEDWRKDFEPASRPFLCAHNPQLSQINQLSTNTEEASSSSFRLLIRQSIHPPPLKAACSNVWKNFVFFLFFFLLWSWHLGCWHCLLKTKTKTINNQNNVYHLWQDLNKQQTNNNMTLFVVCV